MTQELIFFYDIQETVLLKQTQTESEASKNKIVQDKCKSVNLM